MYWTLVVKTWFMNPLHPLMWWRLTLTQLGASPEKLGLQLVARDQEGYALAVGCGLLAQVSSPLSVEVACFCWALARAKDFSYRWVVFETDCQTLYNILLNSDIDVFYLGFVYSDCHLLVSYFDCFSLSFVRRIGNGAFVWNLDLCFPDSNWILYS